MFLTKRQIKLACQANFPLSSFKSGLLSPLRIEPCLLGEVRGLFHRQQLVILRTVWKSSRHLMFSANASSSI